MAVTDQQFQDHSDQNNAEFSNRQITLRGNGVPNLPATIGSYYLDETTGPPYARYEKTGPLDTDWTLAVTGTDTNAIHDNVAAEISAITEKATPVSGDWVLIEDSEDSDNKKKVQVGNLPGAGGSGLTVAYSFGDGTGNDGVSRTSATVWELSVTPTDPDTVRIYLNGLLQFHNTYGISGTTITFVDALENTTDEELVVVYGETGGGGGGGAAVSYEILESTITNLTTIQYTLMSGVIENSIDVYWFALKITPTSEYSLAGTTLTITAHPDFQIGDEITIKYVRTI